MAYKVKEIEGIGAAYAEKLTAAGMNTTDELLRECCTSQGRKKMSEKTGLSEGQLLKWANMADLMRVSGIGAEFSELLEAAGVDTVKELRTRNAENLAEKMKTINEEKKLTRTVPTATAVTDWIEKAKVLDPMMTY